MQSLLQLYKNNGNAFPRITLDEALSLPEITDDTWVWTIPGQPRYGRNLTRAGKRMLINKFGGACWLEGMDHLSVPFYQAYADDSKRKGRCADFLLGLGETLGCVNRHKSPESVEGALKHHNVAADEYDWYIDMRKIKELNTTGWGMGTERFLCWVMQHDDIRDVQPLPRLKGVAICP